MATYDWGDLLTDIVRVCWPGAWALPWLLFAVSCVPLPGDPRLVATHDMVRVKGGTFQMGDVFGAGLLETPVHAVALSDFYLGKTEVTLGEFGAFVRATSYRTTEERGGAHDCDWRKALQGQDDSHPVVCVSWWDALEYSNWRSGTEHLEPVYGISGTRVVVNWNANGYRLPTEAEWEYAARERGRKVLFGNGKNVADPSEINFNPEGEYHEPYSKNGRYRETTTPVGSFPPNALGLHDMSGNAAEWCWDGYSDYTADAQRNPHGPEDKEGRLLRGGSFAGTALIVRAAARDVFPRHMRTDGDVSTMGFRLARNAN